VFDRSYGYDNAGTVTSIIDTTTTPIPNQSFGYDHRDRLTSWTSGGTTQSYAYTTIGNLTSKAGVSYSYPASGATSVRPHTPSSVGGASYVYDANGNLTGGAGRTYTWNAENLPPSVSQTSGSESYSYDGDGERVKVVNGSVSTVYLEGLWEEPIGGAAKVSYSFNGQTPVLPRSWAISSSSCDIPCHTALLQSTVEASDEERSQPMEKEPRVAAHAGRTIGVLTWVGRALLLAPEAALLAALLSIYQALGEPPTVALLIALLIVGFIVRAAALHLARAALERGRRSEAATLLQIALALYPWSADALALQGVLALTGGAPALAEARMRRAIALLPGQPAFHAALSGALIELGRPGEAAQSAREALALDSRCTVAYLHLAEAERAHGAPAHTFEDRLREGLAATAAPAAEAAIRCALVGHLLAERRLSEATLTLHGAEALLPHCPAPAQAALRFHLGELLIAQGQVERAREYFQGVEALDPDGRYATAAWRAAQL
jgi:tetratricopeptide (TPR) repeat protein